MTNEEIEQYKQKLNEILKRANEPNNGIEEVKLYDKLNNIYHELQSLAMCVGASKHIGTGIFGIEEFLQNADYQKRIAALQAVITEITYNINNALQTATMLNACVSAETSSDLAKQACNSAKWSCIWAAIAAITACITVILTLCLE